MMSAGPPWDDLSLWGRLREFHAQFPLEGDPPNALLTLPDERLRYIMALFKDIPCLPPALSPDEWQEVLEILHPHDIYPLLAHNLRSWPADCRPPQDVMDILRRFFLSADANALRAGRQTQPLIDALESADIPVVVLKGPALARSIYPVPALRGSNDIDLLVKPADVVAAENVLRQIGYTSPHREFHTSRYAYHQGFFPSGHGTLVEVHWSLDCGYNLLPDGWVDSAIDRRIHIDACDLQFATLAPADHLLFIAFHNAFQHPMIKLNGIADISRLISGLRGETEWRDLLKRARDGHFLAPLQFAVNVSALWTGIKPPCGYDEPSTWPDPSPREVRLWKHMKARRASPFSSFAIVMRQQPGVVEKVRFGCRIVVPPEKVMRRYRRSDSLIDVPLAHLRRWASVVKYL